MIKHIALWTLKDMPEEKKNVVKQKLKEELEALMGRVPGLLETYVQTESILLTNADVMLYASFDSVRALKCYNVYPTNLDITTDILKPNLKSKSCIDFEV